MEKTTLELNPYKDYQLQELIENHQVYGEALIALIKDMSKHIPDYKFKHESEDFILSVDTTYLYKEDI